MMDKPSVELVSLKKLCAEMKVDAFEAREKLRAAKCDPKRYPELAKHKRRQAWAWTRDSLGLKEARAALSTKS